MIMIIIIKCQFIQNLIKFHQEFINVKWNINLSLKKSNEHKISGIFIQIEWKFQFGKCKVSDSENDKSGIQ